jgi:TolB-like protein
MRVRRRISLPDAITSSLAGLHSLAVRSSLAALRFSGGAPDLQVIAAEANVDFVLSGSLLRVGELYRESLALDPDYAPAWGAVSG